MRTWFTYIAFGLFNVGLLGYAVGNDFEATKYFLYDITHKDKITMVVKAEWQNPTILYWKEEVQRRYSDAVVIVTHGGDGADSEWTAYPQRQPVEHIDDLVDRIRAHHPYRRIVIIACNPMHQHLDRRFVSYALNNVWFYPDSIQDPDYPQNVVWNENFVGDIFDFVEQ